MSYLIYVYDVFCHINRFIDPITNVVSLTLSAFTLFFSIRIKRKVYQAVEGERIKIKKQELLNTINQFRKSLDSNIPLPQTFYSNLQEFSIRIRYHYPSFAKKHDNHLSILHSSINKDKRDSLMLSEALVHIYYDFDLL